MCRGHHSPLERLEPVHAVSEGRELFYDIISQSEHMQNLFKLKN